MASRAPKALVDRAVLRWLRTSSGFTIPEVAGRAQTSADKVEQWEEEGGDRPSMPQLRKLAQAFKRPISDFFLPRPMPEPDIPHDFRRLPANGIRAYSPALR